MTALREARAGVQRALALHAAHECDPEHPGRCDVLWRSGMCIHRGRCQTCFDVAPCATADLPEVVAELLEAVHA